MIDEDMSPLERLKAARFLAREWTRKAEQLEGVRRRLAIRQGAYVLAANDAAEMAIQAARDVAADHNR